MIEVQRATLLEQPLSNGPQFDQHIGEDHTRQSNQAGHTPPPPFDAYHTFLDVPYPTPGILVPQAAHANTPRARSAHVARLAPHGVRLTRDRAALRAQLAAITDGARTVPLSAGGEFVLVIKWPGYPEWRRATPLAATGAVQPLWRFAVLVVAAVEAFVQEMKDKPSSEKRPDWWVANIDVERLVLLEVRRTGAGTWQPVLCLMVD